MTRRVDNKPGDDEIRGWKSLGKAFGRDESSVREWRDRGLPYKKAGNVYVFSKKAVTKWREIEFQLVPKDVDPEAEGLEDADNPDSVRSQSAQLRKSRIRKLKLEADRLEREKNIQEGLYAPVEEFEQALVKVLTRLRQHMQEQFNELLDLSALSPGDKEKLQMRLVDGFNAICEGGTGAEEEAQ